MTEHRDRATGDTTPGAAELFVPRRFDGRKVIVTGAGSGIGRATAVRIAREGGRVIAADWSAERLVQLLAEFGELPIIVADGDISDEDDVRKILAAAGGEVDGLVNNAGIMDEFQPLHELPDAVWERVLRVNLTGLMRMSRAVLPGMIVRRRGSIVNVASEAGLRGSAAGAAYTASKHAVIGLTLNSSVMYAPLGIRVNAVAPGGTRTNIVATFSSQFGAERLGPLMQAVLPPVAEAAEVAAAITYLLSDDASNISGAIVPCDGGWSAI